MKIDILKSHFLKNVLTLFSGSFIAQLIPLLITPILTRLYPEEVFGVFFIYSSLTIILSIIAALRYELAIVLPESQKEAVNILALCFLLTTFISLLVLLIVIFLNEPICNLIGNSQISSWLYVLPISVFLIGIFQIGIFWQNRKKGYRTIATGNIVRTLTSGTTQICLGFTSNISIGLIWGMISGQFIYAFYMLLKLYKERKQILPMISFKMMIQYFKKYRDIPFFNTLISLLNALSFHMPIFVLTRIYGIHIAGYYGMSNRIISTPANLIGNAVGQVFYKEATEKVNKKQSIFEDIKQIYIKLFMLSILPLCILFFFAPAIFSFVFGKDWLIAGNYTQILIPWVIVMLLNSPLSYLITLLNKQKPLTIYYSVLLTARFLALYVGFKLFNDPMYSILLLSGVSFIFNIFLISYYLIITKRGLYTVYK